MQLVAVDPMPPYIYACQAWATASAGTQTNLVPFYHKLDRYLRKKALYCLWALSTPNFFGNTEIPKCEFFRFPGRRMKVIIISRSIILKHSSL